MKLYRAGGGYDPARAWRRRTPGCERLTDQLVNGFFRRSGCDFWGVRDALLTYGDEYFVLRDFDDYVRTWEALSRVYGDPAAWNRDVSPQHRQGGVFLQRPHHFRICPGHLGRPLRPPLTARAHHTKARRILN